MKNKPKMRWLYCLCLLFTFTTGIYAQPDFCPRAPYNMNTLTATSQPQVCKLLRQDFVPTPADCVLTVNINIYVFNKDDGSGNYSITTQAHIYNVINVLNNGFANLQPPWHTVANQNVPFIPDSKIRFALKSYHIINETYGYKHVGSVAPGSTRTPINDCNAINIIYSDTVYGAPIGSYAQPAGLPWGKYITMPGGSAYDGWGNPRQIDQMLIVLPLFHELGHTLGLDHTLQGDNPAIAKAEIGHNSCCDRIVADDVFMEPPTIAYAGSVCTAYDPNNPPLASNNFMASNNACKQYLSPFQLAIMHYHLRTNMLDVLTPAGYNNAVNANHGFDLVVSSNQTLSSDRYMKGNITINPGVELTISCNVAMTQNASIIVEPGGKLVIDGGQVTNISGRLWAGIQVGGSATHNQAVSGGGFAYQGFLKMINGATLSHAENAVRNYMTDPNDNIIWSSSGGVVRAADAYFINNSRDAEFIYYNTASSASKFYNCNFTTNGVIGKNISNAQAGPFARVSLYGIDGVGFYGCNFEYAAGSLYADHGYGILSCDAVFNTGRYAGVNSKFSNFKKGIQVGNGIAMAVNIRETDFEDNIEDAIYLQNTDHSVIDMNNIKTKLQLVVAAQTSGIYLHSSQNYVVKNNSFKESPINRGTAGIYAYNSRRGSHEIFRNNFMGMNYGINSIDNNSGQGNTNDGLIMNCNDFSQTYNKYDVLLTSSGTGTDLPTVMRDQGNIVGVVNAMKLARNQYAAQCGNQSKWYTAAISTKTVNHGCNSDAITQPLPQPSCSRNILNVISFPIALNYAADCPQYPASSGGTVANTAQRLANINTYLGGLQALDAEERDYFEIEAALGGKLNIFLSDTLPQSKDSVIAVLANNQNYLADADLHTVFAYMHKGDLTGALDLISSLDTSTRAGWKTFLLDLVDLYQDSAGVYSLKTNADRRMLMESYAAGEHEGKHIAQGILKFAVGAAYSEPRPGPDEETGSRLMQPQAAAQVEGEAMQTDNMQGIAVYPNPASESLSFAYKNAGGRSLQLVMSDALGRRVLEAVASPGAVTELSLAGLPNGVYLLNAYDNKTSVYQTKVICIK